MTKLRGLRIALVAMATALAAGAPGHAGASTKPSYGPPPAWVDVASLTNTPAPDGSAAISLSSTVTASVNRPAAR